MKILCKNMCIALFALCFGLVLTPESQAKVCFVGDEDCAGSMDFGDYKAPDGATLCDGYTQAPCAEGKHINGYCPYDSSYVMCCGPEFVYDDCAYPRIYDGKCGNKYSCTCDLKKFPYTDETCAQAPAENGSEPGNAYPAGGSCTLGVVEGDGKTAQEIYYSACMCDRATYPQPLSKCAVDGNGKPMSGDICRDSEGNEYTTTCRCDWDKFPVVVSECDYGGDGDTCIEGGVTRAEDCCSCEDFPVTLIDGKPKQGGENLKYASDWDVCGCPLGKNRVKITQCAAGWEPTDAGDGCQRIECDKAVKLFFSKPENIKAYKNFAVFDGSRLITYEQLTDEEKEALPTKAEQTYAVGDPVTNTTATKGIVIGNINVADETCYKLGFACTNAEELYSPSYFAYVNTAGTTPDDIVMIKEACAKEAVPVMSAGKYFPKGGYGSPTLKVYGVGVRFTKKDTSVDTSLEFVNAPISSSTTGGSAIFSQEVKLTRNKSAVNSNNAIFAADSTFKYYLTSNGYSFDASTLDIKFYSSSYKNKTIATFKFNGGETFDVDKLIIAPSNDARQTYCGTMATFTGPRNSDEVQINVGRLYLGYASSNRNCRSMSVKLAGNLAWNMEKGNSTNYIYLSPNSQIYSNDFRAGSYYAKIRYSSNGVWQKCTMRDHIRTGSLHWGTYNFGCNIKWASNVECEKGTLSDDYLACSVNKDNKGTAYIKDKVGDWRDSNRCSHIVACKAFCKDEGHLNHTKMNVGYDCTVRFNAKYTIKNNKGGNKGDYVCPPVQYINCQ